MRRSLVRLISWLPVAALVLGVAAVVYLHVRYSPRCTIVTEENLLHVADDGEWLLTETPDAIAIGVWSTRTAESKTRYPAGKGLMLSQDLESLLGADPEDTLQIIDWRNDRTRTVVIGEPIDNFYSRPPWCVVTTTNGEWMVVDLRDERIARRFSRDSDHQWRDDGRLLVQDGDGIHLWNLAEMRVETTLLVGPEKLSERSPGSGRWIVTSTVDEKGERYSVWDLTTKSKRHALPDVPDVPWPRCSVDGERIGYLLTDHATRTSELVVLETGSGKTLLRRDARYNLEVVDFSLDARRVILGNPGTVIFEVDTGKLIHDDFVSSSFLYRKNLLVPWGGSGAIRDARTGEVVLQISNVESTSYSDDERFIVISSDTTVTDQYGRWLANLLPRVFGEGLLVQVFETDNLREVYRVRSPSRQVPGSAISKDGSVFVTQFDDPADDEPARIDVWDMNPRRAQVYAGLSGAAAVLAVIAFRVWRRRRKVSATD